MSRRCWQTLGLARRTRRRGSRSGTRSTCSSPTTARQLLGEAARREDVVADLGADRGGGRRPARGDRREQLAGGSADPPASGCTPATASAHRLAARPWRSARPAASTATMLQVAVQAQSPDNWARFQAALELSLRRHPERFHLVEVHVLRSRALPRSCGSAFRTCDWLRAAPSSGSMLRWRAKLTTANSRSPTSSARSVLGLGLAVSASSSSILARGPLDVGPVEAGAGGAPLELLGALQRRQGEGDAGQRALVVAGRAFRGLDRFPAGDGRLARRRRRCADGGAPSCRRCASMTSSSVKWPASSAMRAWKTTWSCKIAELVRQRVHVVAVRSRRRPHRLPRSCRARSSRRSGRCPIRSRSRGSRSRAMISTRRRGS